MSGFDWPALMRCGIGDMRLKPNEFWALTPAEFLLMTGMAAGPEPLRRAGLDALMKHYPDVAPEGEPDARGK